MELVRVDFTRLVEVNGIEETKDGLTAVRQVVGEHEKFLRVFIVVVMVVVVVEVVVSVMDLMDDRPAGHEEHALGHGVVEQVEEGGTEGHDDNAVVHVIVRVHGPVREGLVPVERVGEVECRTQSGEDVSELRHRRVGEDFLEVVLDKGDGCSHHGRGSTDGGDDEGQVGQFTVQCTSTEELEHAGHEVKTGVDHGRSVNESGNRGWAFHGVRQPHVEWELG